MGRCAIWAIRRISELGNETIKEVHFSLSKSRSYLSQICAAFATNLIKCSVGTSIGFTAILVAELSKENAEIYMSIDDLGWFSSNYFMGPVGALFLGTIAQRIGSRLTLLISAILYVISFLTFYLATNTTMLLCAQVITGLLQMIGIGPGNTYATEIAEPPLRSALNISTVLSTICASFFVVLLSNFFYWRTIVIVMLAFPITGFFAVCAIPESPYWLASKNQFDKAENSLCWLRGWTFPENVASEFNTLKKTLNKSFLDTSTQKSKTSFINDTINAFSNKSFYVPLLSICLMSILHSFTGSSTLVVYSIVIFKQINSPISSHVAASIFDALRIFGALLCIVSVRYTGKNKLVYISLIGATLSLFISSITLLFTENYAYSEVFRWVPTIGVIFTTFSTATGIDKILGILIIEIFPAKYRNIGSAIGLFTFSVFQAISAKLYLTLLEAFTLPGVFIIFGFGCIITCIVFYLVFPETEGRTLQEIEDHYSGVKKL